MGAFFLLLRIKNVRSVVSITGNYRSKFAATLGAFQLTRTHVCRQCTGIILPNWY